MRGCTSNASRNRMEKDQPQKWRNMNMPSRSSTSTSFSEAQTSPNSFSVQIFSARETRFVTYQSPVVFWTSDFRSRGPMVAYMATRPCLISVSRRRLKFSMSPELADLDVKLEITGTQKLLQNLPSPVFVPASHMNCQLSIVDLI